MKDWINKMLGGLFRPSDRESIASDSAKAAGRIEVGDFYLAPESESVARAVSLLPTKGSEDASSVLGMISIPDAEEPEYLPTKTSEWIVYVDPEQPGKLVAKTVEDLFGKTWREKYGGLTIYGKDVATGLWTFL